MWDRTLGIGPAPSELARDIGPWPEANFRLGQSTLLSGLARNYALAPSAVLIRTAEAELLRRVPIETPALDLCCGDGFFASLIRPTGFGAGCDLDLGALKQAAFRHYHDHLVCAVVAGHLPYVAGAFASLVSNSSLEHVQGIGPALAEVARVLKPGGRLYMTFLSHFAYEWWPVSRVALQRYRAFQPVHNAFSLEEWRRRLSEAGLSVIGYRYYLSRLATRVLLWLDYHYSRVFLTTDVTPARFLVRAVKLVPARALAVLWRMAFAGVRLEARGAGGGILIVAEKPLA
jgi:SAM-dependent methyltransferase